MVIDDFRIVHQSSFIVHNSLLLNRLGGHCGLGLLGIGYL